MKKTFKSILVIVLALLMVVSIAACSNTPATSKTDSKADASSTASKTEEDLYYNKTGYPICDKAITLTATGMQGSTDDWSATDTIWYFRDNFGIELECHEYSKDEWPTKWTTMLSTDTLYDMIIYAQCSYADMVKYGEEGYFLNFAEYADLMPNYANFCAEFEGYDEFLRQPSGELWGFNIYNAQGYSSRSEMAMIPQDWLENLNLEIPTTIDELHDVLVAFKEKDANGNGDPNDEIPMMMAKTGGGASVDLIKWGYGIKSRDINYILQADENNKVYLADITDEFRAFLTTISSWLKEGLIDEYWQTRDDQEKLFKENAMGWGMSYSDSWWKEAYAANPDTAPDPWPICSAFTQNEDDERFTVLNTKVNANKNINMLASSNCEYPEALVRLYDYYFDLEGEGCNSALLGWEGINYDIVEVMGKGYGTFDCTAYRGDKANWDYRRNAWIYQSMCTAYLRDPSNWGLYDYCTTEELMDHTIDELTQFNFSNNGREVAVREDGLVFYETFLALGYVTEEAEVRTKYYTDILNELKVNYVEFISGTKDVTDDKVWNSYVDSIKAMGLDELLAAEQSAYDRWLEANK